MAKMIMVTEITAHDESKNISINSNLILKIEDTDEDGYGNSIISFTDSQLEIHTNETMQELNSLINNG